jgi:uncharacterized membrane protein YhhN
MNLVLSVVVIAISAFFTVYSKYKEHKVVFYAFKPLTMVLIISLAWEKTAVSPSVYSYLVLSGLCLSLLGDIFVMLPARKFLRPGLVLFLAAYVLYAVAFIRNVRIVSALPFLIILAVGAVVYLYLYGKLDTMRIPVLIYVLVVALMGWLAINRYLWLLDQNGLLVMSGGVLLVFSDMIWGINKFRLPFRLAEILILASYFPAQLLFALSI